MAWAKSNRSPAATKVSSTRLRGRPTAKKLAWSYKDTKLWYVDINEKKQTEADKEKYGEILNYSWSPDSKWLADHKNAENGYSVVHLYSIADSKITPVTTSITNSFAPVFDPDGKYLYFLSDRDFNEVLGNVDFEFANPKTTRIYMVTLRKDETSPFLPLSDETQIKPEETKDELVTEPGNKGKADVKGKKPPKPADTDKDKDKDKDKKDDKEKDKDKDAKEKEKEKPKELHIDLDGIQGRIVALPIEPAIINTYLASKGFIYYSTTPIQAFVRPDPGANPPRSTFTI